MNKSELEKKFLALVSKEQAIIHKICNIYCSMKEDKQDLFQEITIQLWRSFPAFKGNAKITTWMYRVALNTAITFYRKEKKKPGYETITELTVCFADKEPPPLYEEIGQLYIAIEKLNRIEKALIFLYLEENTYEEIALVLGITKTNVGVKINRIKVKLETLIKAQLLDA